MRKIYCLITILSLFASHACGRANDSGVSFPPLYRKGQPFCENVKKIKGVSLGIIEDNRLPVSGYGSAMSQWAIEEIKALGARWVTITPYATMINCNDNQVIPYFEFPRKKMEKMVIKTIRQAHLSGLHVFLANHIYPWDWCWRGNLLPISSDGSERKGWEIWLHSYKKYLMHWANIARQEKVEMFSIGVEFKSASAKFPGFFSSLADEIRLIYKGKLTYCANWDEAEDVIFWDKLDYIGVNGFYPLGEKNKIPTISQINTKLENIRKELKYLSKIFHKPVIFTEIGYKALKDDLAEPWLWPEEVQNAQVDEGIQALLFDITFSHFWEEKWFDGLFIWRYTSDPSDYSHEYPFGYSPRLKPASNVIEQWFKCGL